MEALNHIFPAGLPWPELFIAFAAGTIIYIFFSYTVISNSEESALDYNVPVPEQCKPDWKGKILEGPNIKVGLGLRMVKALFLIEIAGSWFKCCTMLLPSDRKTVGVCQSSNA